MSEQKPEAVWVFPEEPKKRGGRIALIIGLIVAVLIVAAVVVLFLIPRGDGAAPSPSSSPSSSPTSTAIPTVVPTDLPTAPVTSPPPASDPSVDQFRAQVQPRLDSGTTGLALAEQHGGDIAVQVVDSLQNDAQILAGEVAPSSIAPEWSTSLSAYSAKLQSLRAAFADGGDASGALSDARSALAQLRGLVGL